MELVGGCDILTSMYEKGELEEITGLMIELSLRIIQILHLVFFFSLAFVDSYHLCLLLYLKLRYAEYTYDDKVLR